jgi:predicted transcriptional regulator
MASLVTVDLPDELCERLRQVAEQEHRSMDAVIVAAIEEYVSGRRSAG